MAEASAKRVTGDEPQGTMGRVQSAGEARCLLPAFLCAHIFIKRETSGYEAVNTQCLGHVFVVIVVVYRRLARRCGQSMGHQRWFITLDRARGWGGDWFSHVLL